MISVTSTRGARVRGGANGDRGGRLSPASPMAALSPPAVAPRLGGFFYCRPKAGWSRAVIGRPKNFGVLEPGSRNLDRERPDGQKPHNIVGTFIWAGGFSSVYGLPMRSFSRNRPPRLHTSPTAPALRVSTLLRRSDTLRPFSVCDRAQTWLHHHIAPAMGRRFFADGLSACLRPRA